MKFWAVMKRLHNAVTTAISERKFVAKCGFIWNVPLLEINITVGDKEAEKYKIFTKMPLNLSDIFILGMKTTISVRWFSFNFCL